MIQKSVGSNLPEFDSRFPWFELNVEYPIALGREGDRVVIDELEVIVGSELELGCGWDGAFIFEAD